ncbi:MAG TPA: sugar ABC transporter permease [Chloroflexota bacterium]
MADSVRVESTGSPDGAAALGRARRPGGLSRLSQLIDREDVLGYLLVAPVVLIVLGLLGYPFLLALALSLTDKVIGAPAHFIGLKNFTTLITDPIYRQTVRNTLVYTTGAEILKVPIGFALALVLNERLVLRKAIRAVVLLPWIVPAVLSAMAWSWMFNPNFSILNYIIVHLGIAKVGPQWLTDPNTAMFSVILVNAWRGSPFFGIVLLAALQSIPSDLYEATAVDGAGMLARFRHVTLPLVLPILAISLLLSTIATFSDFNIVYTITGGGPVNATHVLATLSFTEAIGVGRLGEGAAISLTMFPVLLILLFFEIRWLNRRLAE